MRKSSAGRSRKLVTATQEGTGAVVADGGTGREAEGNPSVIRFRSQYVLWKDFSSRIVRLCMQFPFVLSNAFTRHAFTK